MILEQFASVFNYIFFLKNCCNKRNMSLSKSLISAITKKQADCWKHVSCSNFQRANHINRENTGTSFTLTS